jgi:hypothetical protein
MNQRDCRRVANAVLNDFDEIVVIQGPQPPVVDACDGMTPLQRIWGQWPGDETIEVILDALKEDQ